MKNILVATDLSERPGKAMDRAALFAKLMGAMLHIVYVVDGGVTSTTALAWEENATFEPQKQIKEAALFQGVKTKIHVEYNTIVGQDSANHLPESDLVVLNLRLIVRQHRLRNVGCCCKASLFQKRA